MISTEVLSMWSWQELIKWSVWLGGGGKKQHSQGWKSRQCLRFWILSRLHCSVWKLRQSITFWPVITQTTASCPTLHMWNCQHGWEGSGMAHSLYLLLWIQQRGRRSEGRSNKRIGMESWNPRHHIPRMAAEPLPKALRLVLKSLTFWIKHIIFSSWWWKYSLPVSQLASFSSLLRVAHVQDRSGGMYGSGCDRIQRCWDNAFKHLL